MLSQKQVFENTSSQQPIFIKRKGGIVLIYDGLQYYKHKTYKNGNQFWVCSESKKKKGVKCLGSVTLQDNKVVKKMDHGTKNGDNNCCTPDHDKTEVLLAIEKAKEDATTSNEPLSRIYKRAVEPLYRKGLNFVTPVPSFSSKKHIMNTKRKQGFQSSKTLFKDIWEVEVPGKFLHLLLADYTNYTEQTRIIVFCSEEARKKMEVIEEYFIDGTFYSAPKPFYQLIVLHGDDGSTSTNTKTVPLIYALMSNKTERSYCALFDLITHCINNWKPKIIHADFEPGPTNALKLFFPDIIIKRCYFHFTQNIWKKSKNLGIKNKIYKRIVGLCSSLPLVPHDRIAEGWQYILSESETFKNAKIREFIQYFEKNYIRKNVDEWCVFNERHRTNNVTESWNSKHNKEFKKPYVTLNKLLTVISQNTDSSDLSVTKRRKEHCEKDQFILHSQMQLIHNEISLGHFLEKMR